MPTTTPTRGDPVYLCEDCAADNQPWYLGAILRHNICALCGGMAVSLYDARVLDPWDPHGYTRPVPTTCVTVEPYRPVVWDVNGYYRELGVSPYASRLEIRRAYQAAQGHVSPRLTYIVKQLLDPEIRAKYDACEPGSLFFDRYLEESFEQRVARDIATRRDLGEDLTHWDEIEVGHLRNNPIQVVDTPYRGRQTDPLGWRNYLWRTPSRSVQWHRLRRWQELLLEAATEQQEVFRFAVGLAGGRMAQPWRVEVLDGHLLVVFLDDQTPPSREMASDAVRVISRILH